MKSNCHWPQRAMMIWLTLLLATFMSAAQAAGISIYLQKPANWGAAQIHYFDVLPAGAADNTAWPGVEMTSIGEGWYVQHFIGATSVSMVFTGNNNGTLKSADQMRTASGCFKDNVWTDLASCSLPAQPVLLSAAPATSTFTTPLSVTLAMLGAPEGAKGRYSLDGSDPATTGTEFTNGDSVTVGADLEIGESVTLKLAYEGETFTATYTKADPTAGMTIHVKAPAGVTELYSHYWNILPAGSVTATAWPGFPMISLGESWFRLHLQGATKSNFIFHKDAAKTDNLTREGSGCYDMTTATWTDSCEVPAQPTKVSASVPSKTFRGDSLSLVLSALGDGVTGGLYSLNNIHPRCGLPFTNGQSIVIAEDIAIGDSITLRLYAKGDNGEAIGEYTYTKAPPPPADAFSWDNATVYFVMIDRFLNADPSNDNSYDREKSPTGQVYAGYQDREGAFQGGDLKGLTQKLNEGYFNDLGVTAIWVTSPYEQIHGFVGGENFKHYAYHGYYALDFASVDANYGTENDLRTFIDTAHEKGIRVVFDIVMNHAGYETMADMDEFKFGGFNAGWDSYYHTADPTGIHYETYSTFLDLSSGAWASHWWGPDWIRKSTDSGDRFAGYDACGGDEITQCLSGLPDFKTESSKSVSLPPLLVNKWGQQRTMLEQAELDRFFSDTGLQPTVANHLIKWLTDWVRDYGVDGFRVDTAKHVNMAVWAELKRQSVAAYDEWKKANPDKLPDDQDLPFWMTGEVWGHGVGRSAYFDNGFDSIINFDFPKAANLATIEGIYSAYAAAINSDPTFNVLSYISSHDTALSNRAGLIDAGSALLMAPGAVQIYYGDETARPGDAGFHWDQPTRSKMNWNSINKEVLSHWQKLGKFRANHQAVGAGAHEQLGATPYTFSRTLDYDKVVIAFGAPATATLPVTGVFADGAKVRDFYSGQSAVVADGSVTISGVSATGVVLLERAP